LYLSASLKEVVARVVLRLEAHLALPSLTQVCLHCLVLLSQSVVLQGLGLNLVLDEFLIMSTLDRTASVTELTVRVDLVGQTLQKVFLLHLLRV